MAPRTSLWPLLALLAAIAAAVFFWPSTPADSIPAHREGEGANAQQPSSAQGSSSSKPESAATLDGDAEEGAGEREASHLGHTLRVLNEAGEPLAGVTVGYYEVGEDRVESALAMWADPDQQPRPEQFIGRPLQEVTDEEGLARLPIRGLGAAGVVDPRHGIGCLVLPAIEAGEQEMVHELRLQPTPFLEVHCLDAEGQPVSETLLDLSVSSKQRAAEASGENRERPAYRGGIWYPTDVSVRSDESGRAWMPVLIPDQARRELGEVAVWVARVEARMPGTSGVSAEATLPASEPLILRFPPTGRLTVQLEGFPARTVPLLEVVGVDEAAALRPENPGATGVFEFAQVPVDLDFEARFMTVQIDDDGIARRWRALPIPRQAVQGLSVAGEHAQRRLVFRAERVLVGQFSVQESRKEHIDWDGSFEMVVKAIPLDRDRGADRLSIGVFSDGSFLVPLADGEDADAPRSWADYHTICFEWHSTQFGLVANDQGASPRRSVFAQVDLPPADTLGRIDLGTVPLHEEPVLLTIRVEDESGEPLEGINLQLLARTARPAGDHWLHRAQGGPSTDSQGRSWVQDYDWYSEFHLADPDHPDSRHGAIEELSLRAHSSSGGFGQEAGASFETTTVKFPPSQKQVTIQMKRAGAIEMSVFALAGLERVGAYLVAPGQSLTQARDEQAFRGMGSVNLQRADPGELCSSVMQRVELGTWDFVMSVDPGGIREVLRIPNVVVSGDAPCRDPRLQEIDLGELISLYEVEVRDEEGRLLGEPEVRGEFGYVLSEYVTMNAYVDFSAGRWRFAEPRGVAPQAWWTDPRWQAVDLRHLRPGLNQITARPRRTVSVRFDDEDLLPEGGAWMVMLHPSGASSASTRVRSDVDGEPQLELASPGKMQMIWFLRESADGEFRNPIRSEWQLHADAVESGAPLVLRPPSELLDRLRALRDQR
ncbi:MAG: hypothetical protein CMJ94_11965 [Planctomycetes bacterium]|nr:hypothetical protein [Planctomycetota bacterium]